MRQKRSLFSILMLMLFVFALHSLTKILSADEDITIVTGLKMVTDNNETVNLLNDAGFEGGNVQWSNIGSAGISIVTRESHSGTSSLEIVLSSPQGREISQVIPTTAGTSYSVSGWAMADKVDNSNASIRIEWIDSTGVRIGDSKRVLIPGATLDWTHISGTFTAPTNAVELRYRLVGGKEPDDSGTVWFDDVELVAISGGGPLDTFAHISNSTGIKQFSANGSDTLRTSAGTGLSVDFNAANKEMTYTNTGVTGIVPGPGISVNASSGNVAITNTGDTDASDDVTDVTAGAGVMVDNNNGNVTITNTGDVNPTDDITTSTAAGGDLSGLFPNPVVSGLQGRAVSSSAPGSGQVLKWSGSQWQPEADNGGSGGSHWSLNGSNIFFNLGKVGIGTENPLSSLHVKGPGAGVVDLLTLESAAGTEVLKMQDDGNQEINLERLPGDNIRLGTFFTNYNFLGSSPKNLLIATGNRTDDLMIDGTTGNVGIGTTSPTDKLHVSGRGVVLNKVASTNSEAWLVADVFTGNKGGFIIRENGVNKWIFVNRGTINNDLHIGRTTNDVKLAIQQNTGNVGIGTTNPGEKLDVNGTARVKVLEITGGADIAEPFSITNPNQISKGSVLIIDEENSGQLKLSEKAYDYRVAGVVSGAGGINPGISLKQEGMVDGGKQIALAGRVYVRAEATKNPIKPGDLLTTSSIPGYAMKAMDREKAFGSVIGKAMTSLPDGEGLVLAIIALQ